MPGYRPQVSSELYTTNGEADGHAANVNGMMMYTPEMSTCATASRIDPNDAWNAADCASVFTFPDDEKLIQQEFAKNVPFALSVAETACHPDQPSSSLGLKAADFTPDPFTVSYARGGDQEVSVVARNRCATRSSGTASTAAACTTRRSSAWKGGETYGGEDNIRFDEYRAEVQDGDVGDKVEVWFTGETRAGKPTSSEHFTYTDRRTAARRHPGDRRGGRHHGGPQTPPRTPRRSPTTAARRSSGTSPPRAPRTALGVLSHFDTAL